MASYGFHQRNFLAIRYMYIRTFIVIFYVHIIMFRFLEMGCFGIGVSRLLAASLEYGLNDQDKKLVWPPAIAPYHICVACLARVRVTMIKYCL